MTRQDYRTVAVALFKSRPDENTDPKAYETWAEVVVALSDALEADNPAFDRMRFQYACTGGSPSMPVVH